MFVVGCYWMEAGPEEVRVAAGSRNDFVVESKLRYSKVSTLL